MLLLTQLYKLQVKLYFNTLLIVEIILASFVINQYVSNLEFGH